MNDREYDTTCLHSRTHGYLVHRDYAAHFFRWGWARTFIKKGMTVLEVGCGVDTPFIKVLSDGARSIGHLPSRYLGVDLNPLDKVPNRQWAEFIGKVNFVTDHRRVVKAEKFDVILNFEVIEHMTKELGLKLLKVMKEHLNPNGKLLLSTPVFNGTAARNHIHEYTIPELADHIKKAGLKVEARFGTFASAGDIKKALTTDQRRDYDALSRYYDGEVAACFYAPLYPDHSRNNAWILTH